MSSTCQGASAHSSNVVFSNATVPTVGHPHVYFLPWFDDSRFKIGYSDNPLDRFCTLRPIYPEIDFSRAVVVAVDTRRIETVLHNVFSSRRENLPRRRDGSTEWFRGAFLDEALDFLGTIAAHRGTQYTAYRNVDALLSDYLTGNPAAGQRAPRRTAAEREARVPLLLRELSSAVIERTVQAIRDLRQYEFESITRCGTRYYLVRRVLRRFEPDAWQIEWPREACQRSLQVLADTRVEVRVDGASCNFALLSSPIFTPIDANVGHEYYVIGQGPNERLQLPCDEETPIDAAFSLLWQSLSHLEIQIQPTRPPHNPGRKRVRRFRRKASGQ